MSATCIHDVKLPDSKRQARNFFCNTIERSQLSQYASIQMVCFVKKHPLDIAAKKSALRFLWIAKYEIHVILIYTSESG